MKIFVCIACENNVCTCTRKQGGKPIICPDGHNEVNWHEVKKNESIKKENQ